MYCEQYQPLTDIIENNTYNINNLSFQLPNDVKNKITSTYIKQFQPIKDKYNWDKCTNGTFTIKSAYEMLSNKGGRGGRHQRL